MLHSNPSQKTGSASGELPARQLPCAPGFPHPSTRTHVRLLGPCFKTGRMGSPQADAYACRAAGAHQRAHAGFAAASTAASGQARALAADTAGSGPRPVTRARRSASAAYSESVRVASPAPIRFPPGNFKHSLTLFSKSFSSFPRGTCSLSVSRQYLALDGVYRPIGAAFPNNPTRRSAS